jgi:aquaporin Z
MIRAGGAMRVLAAHWPEYALEALELGIFMVSACGFAALLFHPASPVPAAIPSAAVRRALMGAAMGLTAIALIYSPMGRRSGAHMNPAVTLTFMRLGRVAPWDALWYAAAQFAGGAIGIAAASLLLAGRVAHPSVHWVTTMPGAAGPRAAGAAWIAELLISFLLMLVVLTVSNTRSLTRFTGLIAGSLVASFILIEAPVSGMSMNPARSFGSALGAWAWSGFWIYVTAPPVGMLLAAQVYLAMRGSKGVFCAKLCHPRECPCIFRCRFDELMGTASDSRPEALGAAAAQVGIR